MTVKLISVAVITSISAFVFVVLAYFIAVQKQTAPFEPQQSRLSSSAAPTSPSLTHDNEWLLAPEIPNDTAGMLDAPNLEAPTSSSAGVVDEQFSLSPAYPYVDETPSVIESCTCDRVCTSLDGALKAPEQVCMLSLTNSYRRNQEAGFPFNLNKFPNLEFLSLRNYSITELPPEIGELYKLRKFHIWSNEITSLPAEIERLTLLETLVLDANNIQELPLEIGNLINLRHLQSSGNPLQALPHEIGNLANLKTLILTHSELSELPPEIGNLSRLEYIDVSANHLTTLPKSIAGLSSLETLIAVGNPIKKAEREKLRALLPDVKIYFDEYPFLQF